MGNGISEEEICEITEDYVILLNCMDQVNFMNCPEKIYENNAETYRKIKTFVERKIEAGECGRMVKDMFLIHSSLLY